MNVGHTENPLFVKFGNDSRYLVSRDIFEIKLWDLQETKVVKSHSIAIDKIVDIWVDSTDIFICKWNPDSSLITINREGDLQSQLKIKPFKRTPKDTDKYWLLSDDKRYLLAYSQNNAPNLYDTKNGQLICTFKRIPRVIRFSSDNSLILMETSLGNEDTTHVFDVRGNLIRSLPGHYRMREDQFWSASDTILSLINNLELEFELLSVSKDSRKLALINWTFTAPSYILDVISRKKIVLTDSIKYNPVLVEFSPDASRLITACRDEITQTAQFELWDTTSGKLLRRLSVFDYGHQDKAFDFSPDGSKIATLSNDRSIHIYDTRSGNLITVLKGLEKFDWQAEFAHNNQNVLYTVFNDKIIIWNYREGRILDSLEHQGGKFLSFTTSKSTSELLTTIWKDTCVVNLLWDTKPKKRIISQFTGIETYSEDFQKFCLLNKNRVRILNRNSELLAEVSIPEKPSSAKFSIDGKYIFLFTFAKKLYRFDLQSQRLISIRFKYKDLVKDDVSSADLYPIDSSNLLVIKDRKLYHADFGSLRISTPLGNINTQYESILFNNGDLFASSSEHIQRLRLTNKKIEFFEKIPVNQYFEGSDFNKVSFFKSLNSNELKLKGHSYRRILDVNLEGKILISQQDNGFKLTNLLSGESFDLTQLSSKDYVVTSTAGHFDATVNGFDKLYFTQGLDIVPLEALKQRYYEPNLWRKVATGETLRSVIGFRSIELPPDIMVGQVDENGYLPIELTNKGGGIGEVNVLINGKEAIADARPKGSDNKAKQLSLKVFIGNNNALIKGAENYVAVKAWNEGHWVVSRGAVVTYSIEGTETAYKPAIHIITNGVSDYTGTELDLKYAAKDAEDVSKALQLGAKQLFGTEKSYIYNLTTSQPTDQYPTKANILKAFEKVLSVAHPLDVVVVYLSGHGINYGGQDGDWYYLTQDAYTASSTAYNDPEIRRTSTLSSNELVDLFKKVPALKQVLMIDACASGKVVENLMAQKDIESTTLRALDRMRDRTGLHIITGCTADAVSYEASKYGQGVLTYSLLEGIRGAALREDQFIDVNKLFQYAHDRVPALAEGIGGIQTPQVFSPQGGQSFDIGILTEEAKKDIPIAKIRPVYIRSTFLDDDQLEDALQLGKKVDEALNEAASKGTESSLIFVDVREYPEGCKLSGRYKQEGGIIKLKLRKKCEGKDETLEISGRTVEEVRKKIISSL